MAWKKLKFEIISEWPLLVHNGALADPTNPIVKEISKITAKKTNKTLADEERIAYLEFIGSLYLRDGKPCIPSEVLEATLAKAAAQTRQRQKVLAGLNINESPFLEYDGPKDKDELWADPSYRLVTQVKIQRNKITRTRPKFNEWKASFIVNYNDEILNESTIVDLVKTAGGVGIGDWRPKFGRFTVLNHEKP